MAITDLQPRAKNIAQSATTSGTWTGTGGTVGTYYRLTVTAGATAGAAGNATGPIGATTFTLTSVSNANKLPAAGTTGTTTYTLQESTDGVTYTNTAITNVTVTRLPNAPTTSATQSFNTTTNSSTFTHAIVYTAGAAPSGTIEFAVSTTASTYAAVTGWTTTNSFTLTRGTTYYFWTRSAADALVASVQQLQAPYVSPGLNTGLTGAAINSTISSATTSTVVTRTGTYTAPSTYRLIRDPSTVVATGTQATYTLSGAELPPNPGQVYTYTYQASLAVVDGGNGGWVTCTGANSTFSITRIDETPESYTNLASSITGAGHNQQYFASFAATAPVLGGGVLLGGVATAPSYTVSGLGAGVTVTASVTAGNASFSINGIFGTFLTSTSVTNGTVIICQLLTPNTVNTQETYTLQIGTVSQSVTITTGAVLPDRLVNLTIPYYATGVIPFSQTSVNIEVSGATAGHEYTIGSGSGTNGFETVLATPVAADGSGNAIITIPNANLPTNATQWVNRLHVRAPVGIGGNNIWSTWGTGSINGGASGNLIWNWSRATVATTLGVGTVSRIDVNYLGNKTLMAEVRRYVMTTYAIKTPGKSTLTAETRQLSVVGRDANLLKTVDELTGGEVTDILVGWTPVANQVYQVVRGDLVPELTVIAETATSPQLLLNAQADDLPVAGKTAQYSIQVKRSIANGGDDIWYSTTGTNQPFEINRIGAPTVDDTQDFNTTSSGSTFTHAVGLKTEGSGGVLQFNVTTTTTPPTTGWQTYPTNSFTLNRSTAYYFWARRSTIDATDRDISAQQTTPKPAIYGLQVYSTDGTKIVFNTSSLPLNLITCKLLAGGVTFSQSINAGATSAAIYVNGMTTTNGSSIFIVVRGPQSINPNPAFTVTRQTGYFTITNNTTAVITVYYFAGRYK